MSDRLRDLERNLKLLRKQQAELEQEAILLTGLPRIRADQTLEEQVKPKIHEYEQEYWQILADESDQLVIAELDAEAAIAEIVEQVGAIEARQPTQYPDEVLQLLQEIRNKLNQPGTPAAAKLKGDYFINPTFCGSFLRSGTGY